MMWAECWDAMGDQLYDAREATNVPRRERSETRYRTTRPADGLSNLTVIRTAVGIAAEEKGHERAWPFRSSPRPAQD